MTEIIFQNVFDKVIKSSNHIQTYFENFDNYNNDFYSILSKIPKYNLLIYILILFLIFHFVLQFNINAGHLFALFISIIVLFLFIRQNYSSFIEYTIDKKMQLKFLHKLMFDDKNVSSARTKDIFIKPMGEEKSYLYLNDALVQFFFNNRQYSQYNISSYTNSLLHCNNVIALDYQSGLGVNKKYSNYELAVEESKKALNEFQSVVYNIPHTYQSFNQLNQSMRILQELLNKHIENMELLFKNDNKINDLTIESKPDNFYDHYHNISANDMNDKDYISIFNQY